MADSSSTKKRMTDDWSSGVSEIIGAVLLVSLVVLAVGIISVVLLSQPLPKETPNVHFITGPNSDNSTLYLLNDGGDSLTLGTFYLNIDGVRKEPQIVGGGNDWSIGKTISVNILKFPERVQIVYNGSGSDTVLLDQSLLRPVGASKLIPDVTITPPPAPPGSCANCDWLDAVMNNITANRILLTKIHVNDPIRGPEDEYTPYFNFTVNAVYPKQGPNISSNIAMGGSGCANPTVYPLNVGDRVSLKFIHPPSFFVVYGFSPQIWEMSADQGSAIRVYINDQVKDPGETLCHCWVSEYKDLHSTIIIDGYNTHAGGEMTSLIVNNTSYINSADKKKITLINVRPLPIGMFLISAGDVGEAPVYFVGNAEKILFDGVEQHLG